MKKSFKKVLTLKNIGDILNKSLGCDAVTTKVVKEKMVFEN